MQPSTEEARRHAVLLATETMSDLIDFWGFKGSMGKIWTLLYLSSTSMSADTIAEETRLSAGAVSMALTELMEWGLVSRDPLSADRKRHYQAETDIWTIIRRIVKERELRMVAKAVDQFARAVSILEESQAKNPEDREVGFMLKRLRGLLDLAKIGYNLVEKLADIGQVSLLPIRGTLGSKQDS